MLKHQILIKPTFFCACFHPACFSSQSSTLFTRTRGGGNLPAYNVEDLGEQALKDTKEHRDLQVRLKDIEDQLNHLTSTVELEVS